MSDLISKRKAIEDLQNGDPSELYDIEDIKYWLNSLPSAEPKTPSNGSITSINPENTHDRTMGDLISRQDAIKALYDYWSGCSFDGDGYDIADRSEDVLNDVPSAEPERLTDDDFEAIRIHLNAQKEKLCNQQRWEEAEEYQRIIDRFMAFASAQPDSQPTCNNLATDTISRQVAIDAVNKIAPVNTEYDCRLLDILDVRYVLTELPPAEPKRKKGKWI